MTETIPVKGHTEVVVSAVAATCTQSGLTAGKKCSVCQTELAAQNVILAKGHTEVIDAAVDPTCIQTGLTEGKHCSVCSEVLLAQEIINALDHDFESGDYGTDKDNHWQECSRCDEKLEESKEAHNYDTWQAVVIDGEKYCSSTCTVCGHIENTDHTEVIDEAVEVTCTTAGITEGSHCSVCGEVLIAQESIDALGHDFENGTYENDTDHHWPKCSRCDVAHESDKDEHNYAEWKEVIEGDETFCSSTCTVCGHTMNTDHDFNGGGTCTKCGAESEDSGETDPPAEESIDITLSLTTNQYDLMVSWGAVEGVERYGLLIRDSNGREVDRVENLDTPITEYRHMISYIPREAGTYSLELYGLSKNDFGYYQWPQAEPLATLEDGIVITVEGSAAQYDLDHGVTDGVYSAAVTWPEEPNGIWQLYDVTIDDVVWTCGFGTISSDSWGPGVTLNDVTADSVSYDLRVVTSCDVTNNILSVTMTPESVKTWEKLPLPENQNGYDVSWSSLDEIGWAEFTVTAPSDMQAKRFIIEFYMSDGNERGGYGQFQHGVPQRHGFGHLNPGVYDRVRVFEVDSNGEPVGDLLADWTPTSLETIRSCTFCR